MNRTFWDGLRERFVSSSAGRLIVCFIWMDMWRAIRRGRASIFFITISYRGKTDL